MFLAENEATAAGACVKCVNDAPFNIPPLRSSLHVMLSSLADALQLPTLQLLPAFPFPVDVNAAAAAVDVVVESAGGPLRLGR